MAWKSRLAILEERLGPTVVQRKSLSAIMRDFRTDNPDATVRQIADRFEVAPDTVKKALKGCRPQKRLLLKTN
jgi:DNA-binding MarR family transcriptional regulator